SRGSLRNAGSKKMEIRLFASLILSGLLCWPRANKWKSEQNLLQVVAIIKVRCSRAHPNKLLVFAFNRITATRAHLLGALALQGQRKHSTPWLNPQVCLLLVFIMERSSSAHCIGEQISPALATARPR